MPERTLTVNIVGDDADLRRAFARSSRDAAAFQGKVTGGSAALTKNFVKAGIAAGATAVSFQAVSSALSASVSRASDLVEQTAKSQQVFGDASAAVEKFAKTASNIGIARNEALGMAGALGNMITALGLGEGKAAQMSVRMVELAADMASFNNEDPSAMLERIRSGLSGEMEPLRRFGSILSATRVEQFAWANGIADAGKKLTEQQKILGRYGLLLQDTAKQQGDVARTQGSLANQSRRLNAQMADLSTTLGQVLVPALLEVVVSTNHFVEEMGNAVDAVMGFRDSLRDFDWNLPPPPDWLSTFRLSDDVQNLFGRGGASTSFTGGDRITAPDRGLGDERGDPAEAAEVRADQAEEQARRLEAARLRQIKAFAALSRGLGLKLDKAGLTTSLNDDIAALREFERAILRQIEREGRTFKLVDQLTQVRLQLASTVASRAQNAASAAQDAADAVQDAADAQRDAWDKTFDALSLKFEMAQATKSLADDLAALRVIGATLQKRIAAEGRTTELLRELFQNRQRQAEIQQQMAENARTRLQGRQFKSLGLTEEGDKPTPGPGSLLKRAQSLQQQIKGTNLDTDKTRTQLAQIVNTLKKNFRTAGKGVRAAILAMLNDISSALDDGGKGPLTKTTSLNSKKLLEGLGLSPEEIRELRGRLSNFNSAGIGLGGSGSSATGGSASFGGVLGKALIVESHTTINLDGQQIASVVTRQQQKDKRRNPQQKRGPNRIGGV